MTRSADQEREDREILDWLEEFNTNDRNKITVLVRSFTTPEDLEKFITQTQEVHRETARRAWAWDIVKKVAAAIVLLAAAATAIKNFIAADILSNLGGGGSNKP